VEVVGAVVGIVLGAGASTRMGRPKQTLAFGEGTLLAHVVEDVEASRLDRVVLVLGGNATDAASSVRPGRTQLVRNDAYGTGCASSLLAGLEAAGDCDAVILLLGDMPGVTAAVIDPLLSAWRGSPSWAAVTEYADGIGHPFLFSADAFTTLRSLHGDKAVWKIVDQEPVERVARITVEQSLPLDVDTWADYVAVCETFGFEPSAPEA
jgi:molybdenum cofactor cytidylyltransferase